MYKISYNVETTHFEEELEWLSEQKIFPAVRDTWDWKLEKPMKQIGAIVDEGALLTITLRTNKIVSREKYRQRK